MSPHPLTAEHLDDLHKSGLTENSIAMLQFHAVRPHDLKISGVSSAYSIPYFELGGQKNCFSRLRLFPPVIRPDGSRQKYHQAQDTDPQLYFPPLVNWATIAADPQTTPVIVEGEKKAAKGCQEGLPCIGVGGLWNWFQRLETGERLAIPAFEHFIQPTRLMELGPDSDVWRPEKRQALFGFFCLAMYLNSGGIAVRFVKFPEPHGTKVGLDDWLVQAGDDWKHQWPHLERIPLDDPQFKSMHLWYQRWRAKHATPEPPCDLSRAVVSYQELLTIELPERATLFPWLVEGSLGMVYGPRGRGKTMFGMAMTSALVNAQPFLSWPAPPHPVGVLYVDGEMPLHDFRKRMQSFLPSDEPKAQLELLSHELVYARMERDLVLSHTAMRDAMLAVLDARPDLRVVILDNISCLFPGIDEDKKQAWEPISAWLVSLRRRGLSVLFDHHAGKAGQQRGTSGREDVLDIVIRLAEPADYDPKEGCHFELSFEKARGVYGEHVTALDVRLHDEKGLKTLVGTKLELSKVDQMKALLADGVPIPEIAESLGISRPYAYKLKKRIQEGQ